LEIEGFDQPQDAVQWGRETIGLIHENNRMEMAYATWNIIGDDIEYKSNEKFIYRYIFIYNVPKNLDSSSFFLTLSSDDLIPLSSIVMASNSTGKTDYFDQDHTTSTDREAGDLNTWTGGGSENTASAYHAVVAAGFLNNATAAYASIVGGRENQANGLYTTISGGYANYASGRDSFIGGGSRNTTEGYHAVIAGGIRNQAVATDTTIGGGSYNIAGDLYATIAGGTQNRAMGSGSVIAGGSGNHARAEHSAVCSGLGNLASGNYAVVGGGQGNHASGSFSVVPGGTRNVASSDFTFAAGNQSYVFESHPGVFIFSDSLDIGFSSQAANEFAVRSTGGVRFVTAVDQHGSPLSGVYLAAGSGSWAQLSDHASKENLRPVESQEILQGLAALPVSTWNYRAQSENTRHIGPMAQDFYAAFGLGENDGTISAVDADGIALAAIQGLLHQNERQQEQLSALESHVFALRNQNRITTVFFLFSFAILLLKKRTAIDRK
jgi:hypothetical protein